MNRFRAKYFLAATILVNSFTTTVASAQAVPDDAALTKTIANLDSQVFAAYNRCDLVTFGSYFSPTVEFYHDKGGATFDRKTVIANTKKYICGKVHRDLIRSTLHIYPVKDFGAIEEGEHRFCETATRNCDGIAKFTIIWKASGSAWQITRVLSYGHRAMTDAEKSGQ